MRHHSQDLASAEDLMIMSDGIVTKDIDMSSRNASILPVRMASMGNGAGINGSIRGEKRYGSTAMPVITSQEVVVNQVVNDDYISSFND